MAKESELYRNRICRSCGGEMFTSAEGIKKHGVICVFEKRTGLTVSVEGNELVIK